MSKIEFMCDTLPMSKANVQHLFSGLRPAAVCAEVVAFVCKMQKYLRAYAITLRALAWHHVDGPVLFMYCH